MLRALRKEIITLNILMDSSIIQKIWNSHLNNNLLDNWTQYYKIYIMYTRGGQYLVGQPCTTICGLYLFNFDFKLFMYSSSLIKRLF